MSIPHPIVTRKGRYHVADGYPGSRNMMNEIGWTQKKNAMAHMLYFSIKEQAVRMNGQPTHTDPQTVRTNPNI